MTNRPPSSRRIPPNDSYLLAKEKIIELLAQLTLYLSAQAVHLCTRELQEVMQMVERCDLLQQGEVYLLCAQAIVKLDQQHYLHLLSSHFFVSLQVYLVSLLQLHSKQSNKPSLKETYTGKLKKSSQLTQHKRKLFDWLFVDRIDRALKTIASLPNFRGFGKILKEALTKSLKLAVTLLPREELQEYKYNIEFAVSIGKRSEFLERKSNLQDGIFIIIDESLSTHRQQTLGLRKNTSSKLLSSRNGRLQTPSLLESGEPIRILERKPSLGLQRNSKRGSLSSTHSKRSSAFRNEEKMGHRESSRWGTKINAEVISSSLNKNQAFRRSNFQQVRARDFQLPPDEHLFTKIHSILQEQTVHQKQFQMTINNLFVDGFLKSLRKMKPFFIYFCKNSRIFVAIIEQLKQLDHSPIAPAFGEEESFRIKIRVVSEVHRLIFLSFPQLQLGSHSKESTCLAVLRHGIQFFQDELQIIRGRHVLKLDEVELNEQNLQQSMRRVVKNVFCVNQQQSGVLIGFIRKISTHFICVCTYNKQALSNYYQQTLRNRMLSQGKRLATTITVQKQLKSNDLTINFTQQSPKELRIGSAIDYIQREDEEEDVRIQDQFRSRVVQNTAKQITQVFFRVAWRSLAIQRLMENSRKRIYRMGNSRLQKLPQQRRLKRIPKNKNSIKMANPIDLQSSTFTETDPHLTYQTRSNFSKKDISHWKLQKPYTAINKRKKPFREKHFIESVRTAKGYQLILHKQKQQIEGCAYEAYFGYKERNPKRCYFYKDPPKAKEEDWNKKRQQQKDKYLKARLTIHGSGGGAIDSRLLISFTKMVYSEQGFGGYFVSGIKLLPHCDNNEIFIQSYWQARQKYFIFIVSAQLFERLTDINTRHFEQRPFMASEQQQRQQTSKKKDKRTSVVASLPKDRETDILKQSGNNKLRKMRMHDDSIRQIDEDSLRQKYDNRTATFSQMQTMDRVIKTADTCSTAQNLKSSLRNQLPGLRKQVVLRLRSKIVRYASFCWKKGTLYLQLKYSIPTQVESVSIVEFEGHQVAMKSLHHSSTNPSMLEATELVLLKYAEPSLVNLSFCSIEGTSQIHLQHIFIKNSPNLYSRYSSTLTLRELIDNYRLGITSRQSNHFFQPRQQAQFMPHHTRIRSRNSCLQQQRKLKYQQIITLARECALPFGHLLSKKKSVKKRCFIVPNRYPTFSKEHLLLELELGDEEITVRTLEGEVLRVISLDKLQKIVTFVRRWSLKTFSKLIITRILKDGDILQLCGQEEL